jgi:hypothetical protein
VSHSVSSGRWGSHAVAGIGGVAGVEVAVGVVVAVGGEVPRALLVRPPPSPVRGRYLCLHLHSSHVQGAVQQK